MSRDHNRVNAVIEKLKENYRPMEAGESETKDDLLLSVIIPARNEFPNIVHTIYSLWHAFEADGFDPNEMEIIIVNNCSTDWQDEKYKWEKPGDRGTTEHLLPRGAFWARKIRVIYDPIAGNHSARNKGAEQARGKYLFFSDAHMAYKPGFFKLMFDTIDKTQGMFHGCIAWMGAYPAHPTGKGCSYTLKLGEEVKGTWNNYHISQDHYFYIPALGHCSVGVLRKQFLEFGGYPKIHRSYGGGEFYLNLKWWMFGSSVSVHPQAVGYHLSSGRGYSWNHDDYVHNVLNIGIALGMDDWTERAYFNWLRRGNKKVLSRMYEEAKKETKKDREFIKNKRKYSFNEVLRGRPWEAKNKEMLGSGLPNISIFHTSWTDLLKESPVKEMYNNSELQRNLDKFIKEELWDWVYKKDNYDRNAKFEI